MTSFPQRLARANQLESHSKELAKHTTPQRPVAAGLLDHSTPVREHWSQSSLLTSSSKPWGILASLVHRHKRTPKGKLTARWVWIDLGRTTFSQFFILRLVSWPKYAAKICIHLIHRLLWAIAVFSHHHASFMERPRERSKPAGGSQFHTDITGRWGGWKTGR